MEVKGLSVGGQAQPKTDEKPRLKAEAPERKKDEDAVKVRIAKSGPTASVSSSASAPPQAPLPQVE